MLCSFLTISVNKAQSTLKIAYIFILSSRCWLHQGYAVAFEQDPSQPSLFLALPLPDANFIGVIQHDIHKLIETDNPTLDADVQLLVQPHVYSRLILQEFEYQVYGLDHNLLHASCGHFSRVVGHVSG